MPETLPAPTHAAEPTSDWSKIKRGVQLMGQGINDWSEGVRAKTQARVPDWITKNGSRFASLCQAAGSAFFIIHARREDARDLAAGKPPGAKLIGLQVANAVELAGVALGTLIPEKADRPEDTARLEAMSGPRYALEKIKQAFNPLRNIRETVGLGTLISGVVQTFTGFQNGKNEQYSYLKAYGPFLAAGGAALLFSRKDSDAWKRFGTIMTVNAINNIKGTIGNVKKKAWLMVSGLASFQLSNVTMFFFAGTKQEGEKGGEAGPAVTAPPPALVSPGDHTPPLSLAARFTAETALGVPQQAEHMGWLKEAGITPEDFAKVCAGFARGVDYVAKKFGTEPKAIIVNDRHADGEAGTHYNTGTETIFLTRADIQTTVGLGTTRDLKTDPVLLNYIDRSVLRGVEEAYHHYQTTQHPDKDSFWEELKANNTGQYDHQNGLERDAERIVRQALVDFGMLKNPINSYHTSSEGMAWYNAQADAAKQGQPDLAKLMTPPNERISKFKPDGDYRQQREAQLVQTQAAQLG